MRQKLPRIAKAFPNPPATIRIIWDDNRQDTLDLRGWIATGGDILAPLADEATFMNVRVAEYGSAIAWGDEDSDLMIDAVHLKAIADEQGPFNAATWQAALKLSNQEAAELLGVALSTWNSYKAGKEVPTPVAIACRAVQRDPIIMQSHYRPRRIGRPRKTAASS